MQDFALNTIEECKAFNTELINGVFFNRQESLDKIKILSALLRVQSELIKIELQNKAEVNTETLPTLRIKIEND